jgi:hypothetical protein
MSNSVQIHGTVKQILEEENGTTKAGKEWRKQSMIVDTGADFNNLVCINAFGDDKIHSLNKFEAGDTIDVSCNVYSREFNGKWYTSLDGWWFANKNAEVHKQNKTDEVEADLPF